MLARCVRPRARRDVTEEEEEKEEEEEREREREKGRFPNWTKTIGLSEKHQTTRKVSDRPNFSKPAR